MCDAKCCNGRQYTKSIFHVKIVIRFFPRLLIFFYLIVVLVGRAFFSKYITSEQFATCYRDGMLLTLQNSPEGLDFGENAEKIYHYACCYVAIHTGTTDRT